MALIREKRIEEILEDPDDLSVLGRGSSATYNERPQDVRRLLSDGKISSSSDIIVGLMSAASGISEPSRNPGRVRVDSRFSFNNNQGSSKDPVLLRTVVEEDSVEDNNSDISNNNSKMSQTDEESEAHILLDDEPVDSHNINAAAGDSSSGNDHHVDSQRKATGMSVRCHCNLASCVTNNYMCKSERRVTEDGKVVEAGCFVQELESESTSSSSSSQHGVLMWNGRVANARRGCIEMLSREKQEQCSDRAGDQVHCCKEDMCNYPKSFYPSVIQHYNSNARASFDASAGHRGIAGMTPNLDHQVWLRAAVIAVPICGLMILVVLILVARRLLRSDEDYKDPDGRRYRRKFSTTNPSIHHHHPSSLPHHHQYQMAYHPAAVTNPRAFGPESTTTANSFHIKPVYMEPGTEFLLPPEPPVCSHCQQPQFVRASSSAYTASHSNDGSRKNNNNSTSSETEELVRSSCNGGENNCRCPGGGGGTESTCSTGNFSDTESQDGCRSFSWNSIRPPSVFSGSSHELPALHRTNEVEEGNKRSKKLNNLLSKIGRAPRSSQSEASVTSTNSRPFNV